MKALHNMTDRLRYASGAKRRFRFVLFRLFDIAKSWPIRRLDQQVPGGFGIMLDDVLAVFMGWYYFTYWPGAGSGVKLKNTRSRHWYHVVCVGTREAWCYCR